MTKKQQHDTATGYHYTSYERWLEIKHTGIQCKSIELWKRGIMTPPDINGIWVWTSPLGKRVERGWVAMLMNKYSTDRIVKVHFSYSNSDVLKDSLGANRQLVHTFSYSDNCTTPQDDAYACILRKKIDPKEFLDVSFISLTENAYEHNY